MARLRAAAVLMLVLLLQHPALAAKLPRLFRLEGVVWEIKPVTQKRLMELLGKDGLGAGETWSGATLCKERRVEIDKALTQWEMGELVLHEVQHAMTCEGGEVHNENLCDHDGIYFSSPKWRAFIRENPALIRFIQDVDPPADPELPFPQRVQRPILCPLFMGPCWRR